VLRALALSLWQTAKLLCSSPQTLAMSFLLGSCLGIAEEQIWEIWEMRPLFVQETWLSHCVCRCVVVCVYVWVCGCGCVCVCVGTLVMHMDTGG
jgi:hypothetical protein